MGSQPDLANKSAPISYSLRLRCPRRDPHIRFRDQRQSPIVGFYIAVSSSAEVFTTSERSLEPSHEVPRGARVIRINAAPLKAH